MTAQRLIRRATRPLSEVEEGQIQSLHAAALAAHLALEPTEADDDMTRLDKGRQQRAIEEQLLRDADAVFAE